MPKITPETKIALGLPRGKDGFVWEWVEKLLRTFSKYPAKYIPLSEQRPHAQARNTITQRFLASEAEYLLWIDSDTLWEPEDVQLLMDTLDAGADIATGIQFATSEHHMPLIRKLNLPLGVMEPFYSIPSDGKPFEIGGCGFGFVLMKREVLEKLKEPWFEFRSGFSEDLYFCVRALQAGFKIYANPHVMVGHMAPKVYDFRDFIAIPESMRQVYVQNAMVGSNQWLKRAYPNWMEDLGLNNMKQEFSENINTSEYWDKTYKSEVENNYNWRTYPGKFPFISQQILKALPENANVLELGAGLGILLEQIRSDHPQFNLIGMDISPYAVKTMQDKGFKSFVGELPNWIEEQKGDSDIDCIIACETLEHLDEEARFKTVKEAYRLLRNNGFAVFTLPDNIMPPSEVREHRVCYNKESFEKFLNDAFKGTVQVYQKKCLVSDAKRPDGMGWAEAPFLFGICVKENEGVDAIL
jgi:2-polyprenyl-3-methyl-5-hydroxy-6-metoxy-1,4-benzoquinol methylase